MRLTIGGEVWEVYLTSRSWEIDFTERRIFANTGEEAIKCIKDADEWLRSLATKPS